MTFQYITIKRIPVTLDLAMSDIHNAAVQREERLAHNAGDLFNTLRRATEEAESRYKTLGLPAPDWVVEARRTLDFITEGTW